MLSEFVHHPTGGRLALDIETVSPGVPYDEYPDFEDSHDFEMLATAPAYESPEDAYGEGVTEVPTGVLFRRAVDPASEISHLQQVAETVDAIDPSTIITYNGDRFDLNHLVGRAEIAGEQTGREDVVEKIKAALDRPHVDLQPDAWDRFGNYTSLEDVADRYELPVQRTVLSEFAHGHDLAYRAGDEPPHVTSGDVPEPGMAYLRQLAAEDVGINTAEMERMLRHYTVGDVEHLFAIADMFASE